MLPAVENIKQGSTRWVLPYFIGLVIRSTAPEARQSFFASRRGYFCQQRQK